MDDKVCWGDGTPWNTSSAYFAWLRGSLRRVWSKHPVKLELLKLHRRKIPNPNPKGHLKEVFGCDCAVCGIVLPMKDCQVDHINPAGSLMKIGDLAGFVTRLLHITLKDLRVVCKLCNATLAYAEKHSVSFEQARLEKLAILLIKEKKDVQWLSKRGIVPASTQKARRDQIIQQGGV